MPPRKTVSLEEVLDEADDGDERKRAGRNTLDAGTAVKRRGNGPSGDAGWGASAGRDNNGDGGRAGRDGHSRDGDGAGRGGHGGRAGRADGAGDGGGQDGAGLALGDDGRGRGGSAGGWGSWGSRHGGRGVGGELNAELVSAGLGVEALEVQSVNSFACRIQGKTV